MSVLLPNDPATAKAAAVRITASRLCLKMAGEFYKEDERVEAFDFCVVYLLKEMEKQHILRLEGLIGVYGRIQMRRGSRCGGGDVVYMQITLTDHVETDPEVDEFVNNGPPCFLIHVVHLWWIL